MNRRRALQFLGVGPIGFVATKHPLLTLLSISNRLSQPYFIDPISVISAGLGIGKLFAGMFGGQDAGPSLADFFQNLTGQIDDLNQKLSYVIQNENEIRALIQKYQPM
jgi:hypothetical protein